MLFPYPQSIPCSFDNFPPALDLRMGEKAREIVPSASFGSKFILTQTPKSRVPQGGYAVGAALPSCRMIYSDTGSDDDFTIKLSFLGYGSFYKLTNADQYLRFMVYKAIALETSTVGEIIFGDVFNCETRIPATADVAALFSYDGPTVQYVDQITSGEAGTIFLNGQVYTIADGKSVTVASATGGTQTYTYVGGAFVIS